MWLRDNGTRGNGARRLRPALLLLALSGGMVLGVAPAPASAVVDATCSPGDFCVWGEDSYTGCVYTNSNSRSSDLNTPWVNCSSYYVANGPNSARNRGVSCDVYFTDYNNLTGGYRLMSRESSGGWWTDPNLGNNYWDGSVSGSSGTVVENDMQSYMFCAP